MRQTILFVLPVLCLARTVLAADDGAPLSFQNPAESGSERYKLVKGDRPGASPGESAEIQGQEGQESLAKILEVTNPPVASHQYVVRGRVKYDNVQGAAFIEMWNDFGDEGAYFTRTMAEVGPMRKITGTSDWRDLELPFLAEPGMRPKKLTINVVMPGAGSITISPLTVHVFDGPGAGSGWWSPQEGGLVGGLAGTALGLLGATIGILAGRCRAKLVVLSLFAMGLACGTISLIAGVAALVAKQPYHVTYPLLLVGLIALCVFGPLLPNVLKRYRAEELRRMAALDA